MESSYLLKSNKSNLIIIINNINYGDLLKIKPIGTLYFLKNITNNERNEMKIDLHHHISGYDIPTHLYPEKTFRSSNPEFLVSQI